MRFTHDTLSLGVMSDTQMARSAIRSDTRWVLNLAVYRERTGAKGAITAQQRRQIAGLSRSTEMRWKRGSTVPDWEKATEVARNLGVSVSELIVQVAA